MSDKAKQITKTSLWVSSIFVAGLLFGQILKLTDGRDNTEKSQTLFIKAVAEDEKGNYKEAVEIYKKAIKLDTTNIEAYNNAGRSLSILKEYEKAIEQLTVPIANAKTFCYRGNTYYAMENYGAAFTDYAQSVKMLPNADAYIGLGNVFVKMNNIPEGIANYTKAIDMQPDNAAFYSFRGNTYNIQGNYNDAINDFNKAIALEPQNATYKQNKEFAIKLNEHIGE